MKWSNFWRLWLQKILRNIASMKFWLLMLLYHTVNKGMFDGKWINDIWVAKISSTEGLAFFGAGFMTLALGRIVIDRMTGNGNGHGEENKYHAGDKLDTK